MQMSFSKPLCNFVDNFNLWPRKNKLHVQEETAKFHYYRQELHIIFGMIYLNTLKSEGKINSDLLSTFLYQTPSLHVIQDSLCRR